MSKNLSDLPAEIAPEVVALPWPQRCSTSGLDEIKLRWYATRLVEFVTHSLKTRDGVGVFPGRSVKWPLQGCNPISGRFSTITVDAHYNGTWIAEGPQQDGHFFTPELKWFSRSRMIETGLKKATNKPISKQ